MLFSDHKVNETCSLMHWPCPRGFIFIIIFRFDGNNIIKVTNGCFSEASFLRYIWLCSAPSGSSTHLVLSCGTQVRWPLNISIGDTYRYTAGCYRHTTTHVLNLGLFQFMVLPREVVKSIANKQEAKRRRSTMFDRDAWPLMLKKNAQRSQQINTLM